MASNGAIPPPIPEVSADLKFNGGAKVGWAPVKRRIVNSLKTQGLLGYTDGSIPRPSPSPPAPPPAPPPPAPPSSSTTSTTTTTTPVATAVTSTATSKATPVFSLTPSLEEWVFRNDRAKGIIESHVDDLPSLMPTVDDKTAKEVFDALDSEFAKKDGMRKVLTERCLHSFVFREAEPIDDFFKQLREIRKEAVEAGNTIEDKTFHEIAIAAFPTQAFDSIIQNITANESQYPSSASVIQQITFQYSRVAGCSCLG
ncbi:hypothetical protein BT96DRAFT_943214 [Gymnopus androsaceus JB14]|uniref:Uncharacterized protein n=1 Tax=Gymnopus androsaceus JB14 TaxID=1447944 RepID=A0A6A4H9H8_9AGAR|nr:hypothetical protein BT96DRAFT_943214 [Gymnopus androsaceus JB14]